MRFSTILLSLMASIWLALCLYLVLPQLIGLNFTGHIVLGGLVASCLLYTSPSPRDS